jgi:hypothetical protein
MNAWWPLVVGHCKKQGALGTGSLQWYHHWITTVVSTFVIQCLGLACGGIEVSPVADFDGALIQSKFGVFEG